MTCQQNQQHSDNLIDTSVYTIDSSIYLHIGLDSSDLFWPKIVFGNSTEQIEVNIQFLQRLYAIYPYFASLTESLDGMVILQDEYTTVRVLQAYSMKIYMLIEKQIFLEHATGTKCPNMKIEIWMTVESTRRLYELKNIIFDNIYRKLILTRPCVVQEIKTLLKHVVNNIDDTKTTIDMPTSKINGFMMYFHEVINTEYMKKCMDFVSSVIFVKNSPRIKVIFFLQSFKKSNF